MEIGPLEAEVIRAVKDLKKASARDVSMYIEEDGKKVAYTTIATTLNRLFEKNFLKREDQPYKGGKRYFYRIAEDAKRTRMIVDASISRLVDAFGPSVVSAILESLEEISPEKMDELKKRVAREREKDAND